jgi:hypothetical protein
VVNTTGLGAVFDLDPDAWAPRKAVYAVAVAWAESSGRRVPTNREVIAALRARGFEESKRRGVVGFRGIRVTDELAAAPRLSRVPGTATAWRQGDRSPASREAAQVYEMRRSLERREGRPEGAGPWDPFAPAAPAPESLWFDGASYSTRVTSVLVARAETVWGPRHGWTCYHEGCRFPATTVDHVVPWSVSHDSTPYNLRPACPRHNYGRGARSDA